MKRLLVAVGAFILLLFVALLAIPFFVSEQTIKEQIAAQLEASAGWRLRVDGPISVSALPLLKLSATDIGLSGVAGADGVEFASAREIRFGLALFPLLSGKVRVTGVTLVQPNIFLETDASGRTSWEPRKTQAAEPAAPAAEAPSPGAVEAALARLRFGAIRINDALVVWDDRRAGKMVTLKNINVTIRMPSVESALNVEGQATWDERKFTFETTIEKPLTIAQGGESPIALKIETGKHSLGADGTLRQAPAPAFEGTVTAQSPNIPGLMASLGFPLEGVKGFRDVSLDARVAYGPERAALRDLTLGFDGNTLTGNLAAALGGERPSLKGAFVLDRIDFDTYRGGNREKARKQAEAEAKKARSGEVVDVPIDLSPLKALDADLSVAIKAMTGSDVALSGMTADIRLANGRLALALGETRLLGGAVALDLVADGRGAVPAFSGRLRSAGLSLKEMAALAGETRPVAGALSMDLSFETKGATTVAASNALALSGKASVRKGSVGGLDLADAVGGAEDANRISDLALDIAIAGFGQPVKATGGLIWHGERFDISGEATPSALAAGNPSPVAASLSSRRLTVGFSGRASAAGRVDGRVKVATKSLRALAAWLGQPLPEGKGLQDFSFDGKLALSPRAIAFSDATLSLDGTKGTGRGRVVFAGKTPKVTGNLSLDVLTLDPYLGGDGQAARRADAGPGRRGWSRERIDFSPLRAVDADLTLATKGIRWQDLKIGPTKLKVALAGGKLAADLERLQLYKGSGKGRLVLDGSGRSAAIETKFDLEKLSVFPFLRDAAGFDWLEGSGNLSFALKTSGASQFDFVKALGGTASVNFRDGAVRGINVAKMLRGLSTAVLLGWQDNKSEKTDFSVFTVAFKIKDGIVDGEKFRMVGPLVRVNGDGTIDMPKRQIKWRVNPKIVPTLQGQRAKKNKKKTDQKGDKLVGLSVPVIIEGSWDNPKIYPDIKGILSNPAAAYKQLQGLGGDLLGGDTAETVDKLLGGKNGSSLLNQLTGQQKNTGQNANGKNANGKNRRKQDNGVGGLLDGLLAN